MKMSEEVNFADEFEKLMTLIFDKLDEQNIMWQKQVKINRNILNLIYKYHDIDLEEIKRLVNEEE